MDSQAVDPSCSVSNLNRKRRLSPCSAKHRRRSRHRSRSTSRASSGRRRLSCEFAAFRASHHHHLHQYQPAGAQMSHTPTAGPSNPGSPRRAALNAATFIDSPTAGSSSSSQQQQHQQPQRRTPRGSMLYADEDDRVMMRDRAHRDSFTGGDREEASTGKAGAVGVGVTRPKRRLSSLPSLSHPFHSHAHGKASPPGTPNGQSHFDGPPPYPSSAGGNGLLYSHPQSTYHALQGGLSAPIRLANGQALGTGGYAGRILDEKLALGSTGKGKEKDAMPRIFGIELKWISLLTLALQNALLTIIMHYSRVTVSSSKTYSASSAVLLNELLKGTFSSIVALRGIDQELSASSHAISEKSARPLDLPLRASTVRSRWLPSMTMFHSSRRRALRKAVINKGCFRLAVPAILYVAQNNLQYMAASNLDIATFQVTYQMKILTTAFFSVILLGKRLSRTKWAALFLLAVGVAIVQLQSATVPSAAKPTPSPGVKIGHHAQLRSDMPEDLDGAVEAVEHLAAAAVEQVAKVMSPLKGFSAVTMACITSGLAGVYFEWILKNQKPAGSAGGPAAPASNSAGASDLWIRNTQLSLFSLLPALAPILWNSSGPGGVGLARGLVESFSHFNGWAIGTVLTQTFGGLVTAVVIRYSDNIMKGFATSLSIIISFLASVVLFAYPITTAFVVGSSIVLGATFLYNTPDPSASSSQATTRKEVAVAPGSPIGSRAPILGEPEKPSRTSSVISLLGLGNGLSSRQSSRAPSRAPSRPPSQTDLMAGSGYGSSLYPTAGGNHLSMTARTTNGTPHVYAASAPGTPYVYSVPPGNVNGLYGATPLDASMVPLPPRVRSPLPPPQQHGPPPPNRRSDSSSSSNGGSAGAMSVSGRESYSTRSSGESSSAPKIGGPGYFANGTGTGKAGSPKPPLRVDVA